MDRGNLATLGHECDITLHHPSISAPTFGGGSNVEPSKRPLVQPPPWNPTKFQAIRRLGGSKVLRLPISLWCPHVQIGQKCYDARTPSIIDPAETGEIPNMKPGDYDPHINPNIG